MKNIKFIISTVFSAITLLFVSCTQPTYDFGALTAPSNLQITANIVGADTANPTGDGSGTVNFTAKADNAITYQYVYDGNESMAPAGTKTYNFGKTGTFTYTVTVVAIGKGGLTTSAPIQVEVLALYTPPADLITMLTNDNSRVWRIKNESVGHMGVGPADALTPIWWAAPANDKSATGMYDDRYTFSTDGTFIHDTGSDGSIFGQKAPIDNDFGAPTTGDGGLNGTEYWMYPLPTQTDKWSIAAPGGQETLTFTGKGFVGYYVGGSHSYQILARSANEMTLKTIGDDTNAWFFTLVAE